MSKNSQSTSTSISTSTSQIHTSTLQIGKKSVEFNTPFHSLPPHIKWNLPRKVHTPDDPYLDPGIDFSHDPGLTDSSGKDDADVNTIVNRFAKTGILPGVDRQSMFADVSETPTYMEALNTVLRAEEQFMSMDAFLRQKFGNDPANFLDYMADPKNVEDSIKLGLRTPIPQTPTDRVVEAINASNKASKDASNPPEKASAK